MAAESHHDQESARMTSPRYQTIDVTEGTGEVLSRGEGIAKVDYTVRTRQELPSAESQECQARRLIDGHVLVREGERQLRGMGPLVLRMQDGREVTFLADLGNPDTGAFTIKVSGSIRQAGGH
jgi:hypothetical protein